MCAVPIKFTGKELTASNFHAKILCLFLQCRHTVTSCSIIVYYSNAGAPSATYTTIDPSSSLIISSTNMPQNGLQYTIYIALGVGGALLLVIILVVILSACCVIYCKRKKNASK